MKEENVRKEIGTKTVHKEEIGATFWMGIYLPRRCGNRSWKAANEPSSTFFLLTIVDMGRSSAQKH